MATLLTGGTGKTSSRIAKLFHAKHLPCMLASRKLPNPTSSSHPAVRFDWTDRTTWPTAFAHESIKAVYMVEPQVAQPWAPMIEFLNYAIDQGVKRFVLCAGTTAKRGQDGMGRVWDAFIERRVEYCVLRPSWFMENLLEPGLVYTITRMNTIFTACQDGKIPFVSADDIAEVAFCALTRTQSYDCDLRVLGPELLTYDEVTAKLTKALGKNIEHVKLGGQERYEILVQAGLSAYYARFFTNVEVRASEGLEVALNVVVEEVTGHAAKSVELFFEENRAVWMS